ncbi:hypothetical protein F5B21DRAFT_510099 [Xylaria acuta]|nr:hypothetical protein F5B21DRAFT_510099 [Xylaria acuta]
MDSHLAADVPSHNPNKTPVLEDDEMQIKEHEIKSIENRRVRLRGNRKVKEYLVRWKEFGADHDEWIPVRSLQTAKRLVKTYDRSHPLLPPKKDYNIGPYTDLNFDDLLLEIERRGLPRIAKGNRIHYTHQLGRHDAGLISRRSSQS